MEVFIFVFLAPSGAQGDSRALNLHLSGSGLSQVSLKSLSGVSQLIS